MVVASQRERERGRGVRRDGERERERGGGSRCSDPDKESLHGSDELSVS